MTRAHRGSSSRPVRRVPGAGHHDLDLPGSDQLVGEGDGGQGGWAHLVDGDGRDLFGDTGGHGGLPGGDLTGPGLDHVAHDHVVDPFGSHTRSLQSLADGGGAEVGRGDAGQRSPKLTDGRPGTRDDHRRAHATSLRPAVRRLVEPRLVRVDLSFGVTVIPSVSERSDPVAEARHAEELGFDLVTVWDHLHGNRPSFETWTLLTW